MQNPETGRLQPINEEEYAKKIQENLASFGSAKKGIALFRVGEVVDVNGGRFRVRKITKKDVILRGIPMNEKE